MKNIYVGNLSFGTSESSIRSLFEAHGAVSRVNIVTDRDSGQPRGFNGDAQTARAPFRAFKILRGELRKQA